MKGLLKVAVIIILAAVVAKYGYDFYLDKAIIDQAQSRVDSMLKAIHMGDDQSALCQWVAGVPVLPPDELRANVDRFDSWRRKLFMVEVQTYGIQRIAREGDTVAVECHVNGRNYTFLVRKDEPISVRE